MLRNTWLIAWVCRSPPGVPNGITAWPGRMTIAGLGVRRGRLPGATHEGCLGSTRDWMPRGDGTSPVPGTTGATRITGSLGVAENALPAASTTHRYEVS